MQFLNKLQENKFLFSELVKRDFKKKYKNSYLGILWSVFSPLLSLLIMSLVFTHFFGKTQPHFIIYIFCGNIIYLYFSDSTTGGMGSLLGNAGIFTKINVPKHLFLFSRNVSSLINFGITLAILFVFCIIDGITFTWAFLLLVFPILCLIIFNLGMGLILSALFVFFRDMQYLWNIFTQLLMYMSAIFYTVNTFPETIQKLFLLNPVYVYIKYFRIIIIDNGIPSFRYHILALGYALIAFGIGALIYKKNNHKFLYYV